MIKFEHFKEITIGGVSKDALIAELEKKGVQFNKYALQLFERPAFFIAPEVESVKLVKVKFTEPGMTKRRFFRDIVSHAADLGLELCPLSLAAFLRLDFLEQAEGPYLTIASAKPENDDKYPNGFYVRNFEGVLWLRGYCASDDYEWPIDSELIFIKSPADDANNFSKQRL